MGKLASSGLSDVVEKGSLKGLPSMAFWLTLQDHGRMKALGRGLYLRWLTDTHSVDCLGEVLALEFACVICQNFGTPTH